MVKKSERNVIVGLDIGTSKVVALIAEIQPDKRLEIIGVGQDSSNGLKRGVVVNIESTVQSIQKAVEEAEKIRQQAKQDIEQEVSKAKKMLTQEVASLSINLTEKLIQEKVDDNKSKALIGAYLEQLKT